MYRVKQGNNEEANYMAEMLAKSLMKKPKNRFDRGDKLPFDLPEPKLVSIKGGASDVQKPLKKPDDEEDNDTKKAQPASREVRGEFQTDLAYDDDEYVLQKLREARVQAFKSTNNVLQRYKAKNHGEYTTISQDEFLPLVTETKYVICHFFHEQFDTCHIMDKHLRKLVGKYIPVRFVRINAEKAPFFVERLNIRVLPTVVLFEDGIAIDRIVGFQGLTDDEDFPTEILERRLDECKILKKLTPDGEVVSGISHVDEKEEEQKRIAAIRMSMVANDTFDDFDLDTTDEE